MTKLESIDKQIEKYRNKLSTLYKERRSAEIKDINYTDKYIYIPDYGYMRVDWQKIEEEDSYGTVNMFFQGLKFDAVFEDYDDDNWLLYTALGEWHIPYDLFMEYVRNGEIKKISKEEFISKFKEYSSKLYEQFEKFV